MKRNNLKIYLIVLAILVLVTGSVFAAFSGRIFTKKNSSNTSDATVTEIPTAPPSTDPSNPIIAKVGEEYIYKRDLDLELLNFSDKSDPIKQQLKEKIALDSQIIQGALKENIFSFAAGDKIIDSVYNPEKFIKNNIYNIPQKDYSKRIKLVQLIKDTVNVQLIAYKGSYVSIWYANGYPGTLGYDESKRIAQEKINQLHDNVAAGKLSMKDAANKIANDPSFEKLDTNYKVNAYAEFNTTKDGAISGDDNNLGKALKASDVNKITNVYQFELKDENNIVATGFLSFGQLSFKDLNVKWSSFENWQNDKKDLFKVIYY